MHHVMLPVLKCARNGRPDYLSLLTFHMKIREPTTDSGQITASNHKLSAAALSESMPVISNWRILSEKVMRFVVIDTMTPAT